jgi:hypothetical protein
VTPPAGLPAESERMPYRRIANGRPSIPPCYAGSPPDGPCPMAAGADGHRRTGAGRRLFDHASGGEGTPLGGAPVVVGLRPGGGVTNVVEAVAHNSPARLRSARRRSASRRFPGCAGLLPPGAARLRCPGERNGACRWLRPVRKSPDAPVRAVSMSRGRGRRGRQSRGTAGCRTRWPGSRIWR